ncbi:(deoxy)nucleoside triphosphate pyrophosphohydrolase [Gillisia sp. Hel_I_29]|uniref:(deoxy)nucleoside triphosphate pyrophosphohydrolase n=1 Tax=Gillisia sp. Hel_I_29 TaxID=1249975 RepID=UPI000551BDB8|nr:(deoxy)nucleoside triphosphate pyrophosphohydrolase [Gillisia sp. Hel_I_29]
MIQVTCALIVNKNKVLCAQRSEKMSLPLKWEFPGGKLEKGETLEDCLKREIKEELGLNVKILQRLPSNTHRYSDKKIIELIPFRCSLQTSEIDLKEHSKIEWVTVSQLENFDWAEADIPIVKHYIQNFK